ncbi:MAG: hypothetical protein ACTSRA_00495 [Promethearchaeota archaeon]
MSLDNSSISLIVDPMYMHPAVKITIFQDYCNKCNMCERCEFVDSRNKSIFYMIYYVFGFLNVLKHINVKDILEKLKTGDLLNELELRTVE